MSDLVAFLRARIDEDEVRARSLVDHLLNGGRRGFDFDDLPDPARRHILNWTPGRVLREVEAKRRILDEHEPRSAERPPSLYGAYCPVCCNTEDRWENPYREDSPCRTVRLLALPYSEHPDYDESWKP